MINTDCVEIFKIEDQVWDKVEYEVSNQVKYQVWEQVEDQVWDRLFWYSRFEVFK